MSLRQHRRPPIALDTTGVPLIPQETCTVPAARAVPPAVPGHAVPTRTSAVLIRTCADLIRARVPTCAYALPTLARQGLSSPLRRVLTCVIGVLAVLLGLVAPAAAAPRTVDPGPAIEAPAPYQGQTTCDPVAKPGVIAFRALVLAAYPGTGDSGIVRACSAGSTSEHKEGRAWDWDVSVSNPQQVAQVNDLLGWLLATDNHGNAEAMARRTGVMYMIWDKRIWKAYQAGRGWQPYAGPNPHTDHVHISFSWAGAYGATSYWTGTVAPVMYAPALPRVTTLPSPTSDTILGDSATPSATPAPSSAPGATPGAAPSPAPSVTPRSTPSAAPRATPSVTARPGVPATATPRPGATAPISPSARPSSAARPTARDRAAWLKHRREVVSRFHGPWRRR